MQNFWWCAEITKKRLEQQLDTLVSKFCCTNHFSLLEHYAHEYNIQGRVAEIDKSRFWKLKSSKTSSNREVCKNYVYLESSFLSHLLYVQMFLHQIKICYWRPKYVCQNLIILWLMVILYDKTFVRLTTVPLPNQLQNAMASPAGQT